MQAITTENKMMLGDLAKYVSDLRIQKHLKRVEKSLRNNTPKSVPEHMRATRENTLDDR